MSDRGSGAEPVGLGALERGLYDAWWLCEHLLGERRIRGSASRLRARVRGWTESAVRDRRAQVIPVERRRTIDRATLLREYFAKGRPVVLEGFASEWPAAKRWTFEWLSEAYGAERVCITDNGDPDFLPLSDALARIESGRSRTARFGALLVTRPELVSDLRLSALEALRPAMARTTSLQFFVGGAGSVTPLHADGTCNFHVQLRGEKVWRIIHPVFNPVMRPVALSAPHFKSPIAPFEVGRAADGVEAHVDVLEAVLRPGDVLFNPSFFWHEVRYTAPSVSVGMRWVSPTSFLRGSLAMTTLMLLAREPSVLGALRGALAGDGGGFYR
jgi:hypothetical protein